LFKLLQSGDASSLLTKRNSLKKLLNYIEYK